MAAAARRLIDHAPEIRGAVDLTGGSLASRALCLRWGRWQPLTRQAGGACWGSRCVWELSLRYYRVCRAGASIAIDDRFEVWDTGYISVPFDFEVWLWGSGFKLRGAAAGNSATPCHGIQADSGLRCMF